MVRALVRLHLRADRIQRCERLWESRGLSVRPRRFLLRGLVFLLPEAAMPQFQTWEEFSRAAEKLYLADPMKVRVVLKYRHVDGNLCIKVTDDLVCLVYRTDQAQDVKKIEKFHSQLMRLMVAKESRSVTMETE